MGQARSRCRRETESLGCVHSFSNFLQWPSFFLYVGMKLHQQTCKAITKCQPALMSTIHKFNSYCERLAELYDMSSGIPLPSLLPMKLAELRNDQTLLEDVWISPSAREIPQWLEDVDVREGIRAVLKTDQCHEEQRRLGTEADNMCRWFGRELCAIELAMRQPESKSKHNLSLSATNAI